MVRVGNLKDSGLIARPLGKLSVINCASPDYLTRFGYPETLDDLASHALIHYSATLGTRPQGFEYYNGSATRWVKREAYCRLTAQKPTGPPVSPGLGLFRSRASGCVMPCARKTR